MKKKIQKKSVKKGQKLPKKVNPTINPTIVAAYRRKSTSPIFLNEFFLLLSMSIFVFLLYSNTLNYPFHFDDEAAIIENQNLHLTKINRVEISNLFKEIYGPRAIPKLSFALNYYFGKIDPFGYRLINIIIHILNGLLVFYFLKVTMIILNDKNQQPHSIKLKLHSELIIPLFSSLIWIVNPLQTNSVTYIVQRMNSLSTMFYLISMLFYIKGRIFQTGVMNTSDKKSEKRNPILHNYHLYFATCAIAGFLSVACKENSVLLAFFIALYEFYFFQNLKFSSIKNLIGLIFIFIICFTIIFQIFVGLNAIRLYFFAYYYGFSFTMLQRVLTEFRVVIYYISLFFFPYPDRLNFDYDFPLSYSLTDPITTLLSLFSIIGLLAIALFSAKKERLLSFGILWFFGNLLIESSIIPLDIIFEHRTYLPSILLSVIFISIFWRLKSSTWLKIGLLSVLVIMLSWWTVQRNYIWRSPITLWQDCVKKSPGKDRPHANLGRSHETAGRIDEAIIEYQKTLKINPYHQFALNNMGLAMYKKGNLDEAIQYYKRAIQSDPYFAEAHNNLGVALIDQKKLEEGILHYKEAVRLKPDHPEAPGNLKKAVEGLNQINKKITETQNKLKLEPKNFAHYYRLGVLYYLKGHFDTAAEYYQKALSIKPDHIKSLKGLSAIYCMKKEYDTAIKIARKAIELQPENPTAYYNIACIYSLQNKKKHAIEWLQEAIDKGFHKWKIIRTDNDLAPIRNMEAFKNIIKNRS